MIERFVLEKLMVLRVEIDQLLSDVQAAYLRMLALLEVLRPALAVQALHAVEAQKTALLRAWLRLEQLFLSSRLQRGDRETF